MHHLRILALISMVWVLGMPAASHALDIKAISGNTSPPIQTFAPVSTIASSGSSSGDSFGIGGTFNTKPFSSGSSSGGGFSTGGFAGGTITGIGGNSSGSSSGTFPTGSVFGVGSSGSSPGSGFGSSGPASSSGSYGGGTIGDVLCQVAGWFIGGVGQGIATLSIIVLGIGALMGKVSQGSALTTMVGVSVIFGAPQIVQELTGVAACYY